MRTKLQLKIFFSVQECQNFVNNFTKEKKVIKKKIIPVAVSDLIEYFVYLEYKE